MYFHLFISIILLIVVSRKNLWVALLLVSFVISFPKLSIYQVFSLFVTTLSNPSVILLAISVGIISIIGGGMDKTGLMDDLVNNLKLNIKLSLISLPGMIGMLPIPGGAILSAPIVNKLSPNIQNETKAAINIWGRHGFKLIYPLDIILLAAVMAGLNTYIVTLYMFPYFFLTLQLIYFFFLRTLQVDCIKNKSTQSKKLLRPLTVLIVPPVVHVVFSNIYTASYPEFFLLLGVSISLILVCYFGNLGIIQIGKIVLEMKSWNYSLIIIAIFYFLNSFKASEFPGFISIFVLSKPIFVVGLGAFLGFVTGRVNVPLSILIPIYISKYGTDSMNYIVLSSMIFSSIMGYIISPIHPCVSVTLEYFKTSYGIFFRQTLLPVIIALSVGLISSYIFI